MRADRRFVVALAVAGLVATGLPDAVPVVRAADPVEVPFTFTNNEQTFVVPDGVTAIHVVLVGGQGGPGLDANGGLAAAGGFGATVEGDLTVTPGQTLYVEVAGNGARTCADDAGFNGGGQGGDGPCQNSGGGGGGASDLRTVSRTQNRTTSLNSRLIIAAGGGGGGEQGGTGGNAGAAGASSVGGGGGAGTSAAGGDGGDAGSAFPGGTGEDGQLGQGGNGATTGGPGSGGGGGGGGLFGGGGGGASEEGAPGGGGGGGGSSFTGDATGATVGTDTGGTPSITVSYQGSTTATDSGTVDVDVSVPTSAACIELSTDKVSFGEQAFGTQDAVATPAVTVTNCSGLPVTLLARATDAAGSGAAWSLLDDSGTCALTTLGFDAYHLKLRRDDTQAVTQLATSNKTVRSLNAGADGTLDTLIDMPCPGSSGAGQTMALQVVYVVTE